MKPDWMDAPDWANWLAMDEDGEWFWHESKPEFSPGDASHLSYWRPRAGSRTRTAEAIQPASVNTLEYRP
jgi:hypothetical protein